jgi:hypothetical protein
VRSPPPNNPRPPPPPLPHDTAPPTVLSLTGLSLLG